MTAAGGLLEREAELAQIEALLDAGCAGDGGVAVVEGPAGIGKTSLAAVAQARAAARGMGVAAAAGSELERDFGFGVAAHLFGPERVPPAPPSGADASGQRHALVHQYFWRAADLAAEAPLLVVADDLQWIDPPSQQLLAYLARRVGGLPLALLVARRPPLPGEDGSAAEAIAATPGAMLLRPGPLSGAGVAEIVARRLPAPAESAFVDACHRVTGGNALLVEAALGDVADRGLAPDARTAAALERVVPDRVARGVGRRLDGLPPPARALAGAVAVLGDGCGPDEAGALADLEQTAAVAAAGALAAADVLADGVPLRFRHPLVGAAVRSRLPAVEVAAAHGRAARLRFARHAPLGVVAAHLLATAPDGDAWVVDRLRDAAAEARAQGMPDLAAAHLCRAIAEPPVPALRAAVLEELGSAELAAGLPGGPAHLAQARDLHDEPRRRARVALKLAGGLFDRLETADAAAVARAGLAGLGEGDSELALTLEALVAECVRMDPAVEGTEPERLRRRAAALAGSTPGERLLMAQAAMMGGADTAAEHAAAAEALARAIEAGTPAWGTPETGIVSSLIRAGRFDAASEQIERHLARAAAQGLVHRHALMLFMRGWLAFERGALAEADEDLGTSLALAGELGLPIRSGAAVAALVAAARGRVAEADALLAAHGLAGPLRAHQVMLPALFARARIHVAAGRADAALDDALELGRRYADLGIRRAVPAWRSLAAVLLAGRGDAAAARQLAEEELALARRWGTPQAIGLAQQGLGLVLGDLPCLQAAVESLSASPARLDLARAHVELGAALRRAGRRTDARAPLRAGMDAARALGAGPLADRARDELRATGARPRRLALSGPPALTVSERRVADLAARGLTNRAIAQALFVTTATVETHLRHAFQKLDVRARGELGAALERREPA